MPGEYRLVIKGHDGNQIGVLSAYKSLVYTKDLYDAGEAVLVASYGVTDATDTLLDELTEDIILEVQRRVSSDFDWYTDWMGFCQDTKREITDAATTVRAWLFAEDKDLVARRRVLPPMDGFWVGASIKPGVDQAWGSALPGNIMRNLVRDHVSVAAIQQSRRTPGLYVQDNEAEPSTSGEAGRFFGWEQPNYLAIYCFCPWSIAGTDYLFAGTGGGYHQYAYGAILRSSDGETWTHIYDGDDDSFDFSQVLSLCVFDDGGGERLFAGTGGYSTGKGDIIRSAVNDPTTWTRVDDQSTKTGIFALCVHGANIYAGYGYGHYFSGGFQIRGEIRRSANGTVWNQVFDGNIGGTGTVYEKYEVFEALCSWGGYIYAGGMYFDATGYRRARVLRSQTGDVGTWTVVLDVQATDADGNPVQMFGVCSLAVVGAYLYAGTGDRWGVRDLDYGGRIYRTSDGTTWEQVFGANQDDLPCYNAPAISSLTGHNAVVYAGSGGPQEGAARVWYSADGTTWLEGFDGEGQGYEFCFALQSYGDNLYAGFGRVGYVGSDTGSPNRHYPQDQGDIWRNVGGSWVSPAWHDTESDRTPTVLEVLGKISKAVGDVDFGLVPVDLGGDTQEWQFTVRSPQWGEDRRSTSTNPVIFGVSRGNMGSPLYQVHRKDRSTVLLVFSPGSGDFRQLWQYYDIEEMAKSPWARREGLLTSDGANSGVELRLLALDEFAKRGVTEEFNFIPLETPSTRYGEEWGLGYRVTAVFGDITAHCKFVGVRVSLGTNPITESITATIKVEEFL